jgi:hypothetical protein
MKQIQLTARQINNFWSKVNKRTNNGCWEWTGALNNRGYGVVNLNHSVTLAHRVSFSIVHGSPAPNLSICHTCDNPKCVYPAHLFQATHKENMLDMHRKNRQGGKVFHGSQHGMSKLTDKQVRELRDMRAKGVILREIAARFSISIATVSQIVRRDLWKHI